MIECAGYACEAGVTLALQNHAPVIRNHQDVLRMVREVNSPALKVCLDVPIMSDKSPKVIQEAVQAVGALQVLSHFGGEYERAAFLLAPNPDWFHKCGMLNINKISSHTWAVLTATFLASTALMSAADDSNPYLGRWALTIPGGGAGWLEITQQKGYYDGSILWGGGSVVPVSAVFFDENNLYVTRTREVQRKDAAGKVVRKQQFTEAIYAQVQGDELELTRINPRDNGQGIERQPFSGKRIPPLPPQPDLSKVKYGDPITLFDGENLESWKLLESRAANGWSVENGVLVNRPVQQEGRPHKSYGNLRTVREFEDFNLTLETLVLKRENSGIYLRGIYEVQVTDSYGRPLDSHNMGGVYSRITPTVNAEKPPGEWQKFDITLVDRHVTVILNGTKIIDNQPLLGCTGGALWSDEFRPGPIYLQGDHTGVKYRNIVLRPVVK